LLFTEKDVMLKNINTIMEQYLINGSSKLKGEIKVGGAKNQALKMIAASILSNEPMIINNCPQIEDVNRLLELLEDIGAKVSKNNHTVTINPLTINKNHPDDNLVVKLRSSIMLAGPLLARFGSVTMAHPGGCIIGQRPIDLFLDGFKSLGVKIRDNKNNYTLTVKKLKGAEIVMPWISVTGTESLMMTACLAEGKTKIINAAMEPEIPALAEYLNSCGAKITGAGTPVIEIEGVKIINSGECQLLPDRIEAGTFTILGLITK
jgi:UDP-N-acetylglucosamine 1-carboxyvinyltransferase